MFSGDEKFTQILYHIQSQQSIVERVSIQLHVASQLDQTRSSNLVQNKLLSILEELDRPFRYIEALTERTSEIIIDIEIERVLDWMSIIPHRRYHTEIHGIVLKGTGQWLLRSSELLKWYESSSSEIMWLHGIPGSGKSRLLFVQTETQLLLTTDLTLDLSLFRVRSTITEDLEELTRSNSIALGMRTNLSDPVLT